MSDHFFAYISRMRYIGRWSLMRNSLPENIQEHSHMVAVLAHALGVIRRDVFGVSCDPNACAQPLSFMTVPRSSQAIFPLPSSITAGRSAAHTRRSNSLPVKSCSPPCPRKCSLPTVRC